MSDPAPTIMARSDAANNVVEHRSCVEKPRQRCCRGVLQCEGPLGENHEWELLLAFLIGAPSLRAKFLSPSLLAPIAIISRQSDLRPWAKHFYVTPEEIQAAI